MLTTNGLLPSIQPVSEIAISSVFLLYCAHRHMKCIRMTMNESPNGEMIFHNIHWKIKPNRHKREREGVGKVQGKTSWSLGLRGKVHRNSTFGLAGFTNNTQLTQQHAGCTLLDIINTPNHVLMKDYKVVFHYKRCGGRNALNALRNANLNTPDNKQSKSTQQ